ncbi:hypothetical protein XENTR_v10020118 [Xenopus tropicalis]|uniref:Hexosyltransferase n=2 Tax=Xenopus tropicalis TaxID=8364 RepID=A0A8J0QKN0_XENTR|nr:putative UDP-GlcNAc:betaGal beta-1,3-N-acetylglucosaminyltransferase LOC100288842 [Xenopus tropicalis]KAE8582423.1 hypothetical protein XENTR_v10020118 [Xenopus tropicalis]|eukprot:XP_002935272.1 PREDICTED: putative UDP-GlcNAc:betaGal beta-1,3-N-acetylglucosaminyltransferase LOC100288842 [Xenopus tropicalis]
MQVAPCRLRTHQWCFILFNIVLFHALLFGADFMEEYLMQSVPVSYTEGRFLEIREQARNLNMQLLKKNISESYVIREEGLCSGRDVFLLMVVSSSPENKTRRDTIRRTWGNMTNYKDLVVVRMFALGRPTSEETQAELLVESQVHKDMVEASFLDTYENRTLKVITSMEWIVTFCPNARFILKVDQEAFVNVESLVDYLSYLLTLERRSEDVYIGRVIHQGVPDREPKSLHFVPTSSYPDAFYPDYCSGTALVISQDVARKVYLVSKDETTLLPPDVFLGMCARKAGVVPVHSSRFSGPKHITYNRCCYRFIFSSSSVGEEELSFLWRDMSNGKECSVLETYYGLVSCKVQTYLGEFKYFNADKIKKGGPHF